MARGHGDIVLPRSRLTPHTPPRRDLQLQPRWLALQLMLGVEDMDVGAPPELIFWWDRTTNTDKEMLMHMSSMHSTRCGVLKK
ncbi:hypothetical protein Taro_026086, partial [Colocasia esculenta]|nr:hypothetical protein [Colocasia esculenta]